MLGTTSRGDEQHQEEDWHKHKRGGGFDWSKATRRWRTPGREPTLGIGPLWTLERGFDSYLELHQGEE